ncbi:MAG: nickel-type superoxide dismutase maturation protease [Actinomycetota bacterium]|nr:nickel-type superoxide dismutase maturation protease [Actinomycetota bacterium]
MLRLTCRVVPRRLRRLVVLGAAGLLGSAVLGTLATGGGALVVARRGTRRVVVEGPSMLPAFEPGDRLLVLRLPRVWPLRPGDVVAVADPRRPERLLIKRVAASSSGLVTVAGDNPAESTDSRTFGPVARDRVWGRVLYRYSPATRTGRIGRDPQPVGTGRRRREADASPPGYDHRAHRDVPMS